MKLKLITVAFLLCLVSVFSANVSAADVSTNQSTTVHQSNILNFFTRIFVRSSTGNNNSSGGSVNTGNSTTSVNVTTSGNSNVANIPCCSQVPQVPEFGLVTGAVAMFTSGGAFLFLKKHYN